jgi:hypothetical protein
VEVTVLNALIYAMTGAILLGTAGFIAARRERQAREARERAQRNA